MRRRRTSPRRQPTARRATVARSPPAPSVAVAAPVAAPTPPSPWRNSKAKKLLHADIVSGRTDKFKGPTGIWNSRPEYKLYDKKNFSSNYYSLRKTVISKVEGAKKGRDALARDTSLLAAHRRERGVFYYPGSAIQQQLRKDVQLGLTDGKTPAEVRASKAIYRQPGGPDLEQFANHLSYERRRRERSTNTAEFQERMQFITAQINPINDEENEEDNAEEQSHE